ncbi:Thioesterase domain protein [Candidatus Magnetomorum sp. HK-1]|nr:Thioesterase domain protein [Candidatus Magnetomorum sp. HK-1]
MNRLNVIIFDLDFSIWISEIYRAIGYYHHAPLFDIELSFERHNLAYHQSTLTPLQTRGEKNPIYCIHPIEGTVFCYKELSQYMKNKRPVYGCQAYGIIPGTKPIHQIKKMAATYLNCIKTVQPRGPYILLGWSFGGVIAYEIACQLQINNEQVKLFIIDSPLPGSTGFELQNLDFLKKLARV